MSTVVVDIKKERSKIDGVGRLDKVINIKNINMEKNMEAEEKVYTREEMSIVIKNLVKERIRKSKDTFKGGLFIGFVTGVFLTMIAGIIIQRDEPKVEPERIYMREYIVVRADSPAFDGTLAEAFKNGAFNLIK